ncbi:uncharacterized protein LOC131620183 [Vicia villosa]|uniref:uncharacterized protein LOC131620183 n=1 Tax=Vicia villosa TaxID=3911 RepID=UPI00273C2887|nr:uncharacterized protein LOC131620183 [Vicia villosa]
MEIFKITQNGFTRLSLYPECKGFTRLLTVLRLFNLKEIGGWTDKSFSELLELLTEMLLEGNTLSNRTYEAKKILCPMGLDNVKIHGCHNDCILYKKEFENLNECPRCGVSRYKQKDKGVDDDDGATSKDVPVKVKWYLQMIPRFNRLFVNVSDAKNTRWYADKRVYGKIRHVADSLQCKKIDSLFPDFANEPRNLRLGLSTDGMNPFGNLSTNHTSWPILLLIYNLSPQLCIKRMYMMQPMMISGPKQPGNDIDVYLSPLIEDLILLWEEAVDVDDAYTCDNFKLRAMLFCTINDFHAYCNLSGYNIKVQQVCPICEVDTCCHQLSKGKETVYLVHRRFLRANHPYRRLRKAFNGEQEYGIASKPLTGKEVYIIQQHIKFVFGKKQKRLVEKNSWKKRSVFFGSSILVKS